MKVINDNDLNVWLESNQQWSLIDNKIVMEKIFDDFITAFGFLSKLALLMEKHNHHPKIENAYTTVKLSMNTHDAENKITERDLALANDINKL